MVIELWILLAALASVASIVCFLRFNAPVFWMVAGLLWLSVAWNSGVVEMSVVYDNSDYLREFRYPFLITFFSLLGLSHLIIFVFQLFEVFREQAEATL